MEKLLQDSLRAYCVRCENWRTTSFMGTNVSGCGCGMNPVLCSLNPLSNKLTNIKSCKHAHRHVGTETQS